MQCSVGREEHINSIKSSIIMFGSMNTYTSMLDKSLEAEKISVSVIGENIVVVDDD